jgi:hypothetical protein
VIRRELASLGCNPCAMDVFNRSAASCGLSNEYSAVSDWKS